MNDPGEARHARAALDATADARALVRLVQCQQCSLLLRTPVYLPCGNTICRDCLPSARLRESFLFVSSESQYSVITCPVSSCGRLHGLSDCSVSVVMSKIMESILASIARFQAEASPGSTTVEEILDKLSIDDSLSNAKEMMARANEEGRARVEQEEEAATADQDEAATQPSENAPHQQQQEQDGAHAPDEPLSEKQEKPVVAEAKAHGHSSHWPWGRFLASFASAQAGELRYTSDALYYDDSKDVRLMQSQDEELLNTLKDASQRELDCYVCYNVMLDPVTTPCGHAFCRDCLRRNLDHSRHCPVCRRRLTFSVSLQGLATDKSLARLIDALFPDRLAARIEAARDDDASAMRGMETALFICTMSFPTMPTYLHIFEPRYRLMIRRALEAEGRFGMVCYNETGAPQGALGESQFCEYGTMLQIERYQLLADGRSFVQCRGVHRFKILEHGSRDGYMIGRVERVEDLSVAEQEEIEMREMAPLESTTATDVFSGQGENEADSAPARIDVDRTSTAELMRRCTEFVEQSRQSNPPWLRGRILEAYGEPPRDGETFPFWLASVLPLQDHEKYRLLPLESTRERLKVAMFWIQTIQSQRWYEERRCPVL